MEVADAPECGRAKAALATARGAEFIPSRSVLVGQAFLPALSEAEGHLPPGATDSLEEGLCPRDCKGFTGYSTIAYFQVLPVGLSAEPTCPP